MASVEVRPGKKRTAYRAFVRLRGRQQLAKTCLSREEAEQWGAQMEARLRSGDLSVYEECSPTKKKAPSPKRIPLFDPAKLLGEAQIVSRAVEFSPVCGVYFLVKDARVVYVGQSTNVWRRVSDHKDRQEIEFQSVTVLEMPLEKLLEEEAKYIYKLKPPRNKGYCTTVIPIPDESIGELPKAGKLMARSGQEERC